MKKKIALALAAAFSLSVAGTSLAAENPFNDLPAGHWAYDYVIKLQELGIIGGYADGTFRGNNNLTRYEIAAIVARMDLSGPAAKDNPMVQRLQTEFAAELHNLGVRIDKLEKSVISSVRLSGDARIRYRVNPYQVPKDATGTNSYFQERVRIYTNAQVNDNVTFHGRIKFENVAYQNYDMHDEFDNYLYSSNFSQTYMTHFDRAYFNWKSSGEGKVGIAFGRLEDSYGGLNTIGQGLIWGGERIDGAAAYYMGDKFAVKLGVADFSLAGGTQYDSEEAWADTAWATVGHLGYDFSKQFGVTVGYSNVHNTDTMQQWAFGGKIKSGDFTLIGEYVQNQDAKNLGDYYEKKGAWGRVQYKQAKMSEPGTFQIYGEYIRLGKNSIIPGGLNQFDQSYRNSKGFGFGTTWVAGKNHNLQLAYHKLQTFDGNTKYKDQWLLATNLAF